MELLVCISLLGIFSGIAVNQYGHVAPAGRQNLGVDVMNLLNRGVLHYSQVNANITVGATEGSAADELSVLALLKARDNSAPGSPYVPGEFSANASSDPDTVRIRWNGKFFQLIPEGTAGTGLEVTR